MQYFVYVPSFAVLKVILSIGSMTWRNYIILFQSLQDMSLFEFNRHRNLSMQANNALHMLNTTSLGAGSWSLSCQLNSAFFGNGHEFEFRIYPIHSSKDLYTQ
jgi:hypothetical protein